MIRIDKPTELEARVHCNLCSYPEEGPVVAVLKIGFGNSMTQLTRFCQKHLDELRTAVKESP